MAASWPDSQRGQSFEDPGNLESFLHSPGFCLAGSGTRLFLVLLYSDGDQSLSAPGDALCPGPGMVTITFLDCKGDGGGMSCAGVSKLNTADESRVRDPEPRSGLWNI